MVQHSAKFPACPECRHFNGTDDADFPCIYCDDGAYLDPRPGAIPSLDRAAIDAAVLIVVGRYLGRPVVLDQVVSDLGLRQIDAIQVMLDLEDEYEARGLVLMGKVGWESLRDLADLVARHVLPGESGEVPDYRAWAEQTHDSCAEASKPSAIEGTSEQEIALSRAACTDGLRPRKGEVIYAPVPVRAPCDTES